MQGSGPEQSSSFAFFGPVVIAWVVAFVGLELAHRRWPAVLPAAAPAPSGRRWLDVTIALAVAASILLLGQSWTNGSLRWQWPGPWSHLAYLLAQLLIWTPLPLALCLRRQRANTAWTGCDHLGARVLLGVGLSVAAVSAYLATRGALNRWTEILSTAATARAWTHLPPIYLEGVGLAFLFVRLQWALGNRIATLAPALLFAAAHVPRSLHDGESVASIVGFFVFNTLFVAVLLRLLARYRDVVALGVVHWWMDLATKAF